jgi:uncharacterized protein with von Willebrand factor type A (vWA) domain
MSGDRETWSKAVALAEFFLNAGGTAFEPALSQALELISKKSKEFRVFGVLIQSHNTETLKKFTDEIIEVAELLDAEAEALMEI